MKNLFIDLGHSLRFPGAAGYRTEIQWSRAIWSHLHRMIDPKKWNVLLVPGTYLTDFSSNRNLINRISWINNRSKPTDLLISIHGNAAANPKVRGVTTCYMGGSESARLEAVEFSGAYAKATGIPIWNGGAFDDRNGRFGRIAMVRDTTPFALLIEAGFVTNGADMAVDAKTAAIGISNYL